MNMSIKKLLVISIVAALLFLVVPSGVSWAGYSLQTVPTVEPTAEEPDLPTATSIAPAATATATTAAGDVALTETAEALATQRASITPIVPVSGETETAVAMVTPTATPTSAVVPPVVPGGSVWLWIILILAIVIIGLILFLVVPKNKNKGEVKPEVKPETPA